MSFLPQPVAQITVQELAIRLTQSNEPVQLIDVREPDEVAIAYIRGFEILSLSQFEQWSPEITSCFNLKVETLVICHHGFRSAQMCQWLQQMGFTNVKNIAGGIDAYALGVDPSLARY